MPLCGKVLESWRTAFNNGLKIFHKNLNFFQKVRKSLESDDYSMSLVLFHISPKLNLGWYKFQKMGWIGNTEMYLIWEKFGITGMSSELILIAGSMFKAYYGEMVKSIIELK